MLITRPVFCFKQIPILELTRLPPLRSQAHDRAPNATVDRIPVPVGISPQMDTVVDRDKFQPYLLLRSYKWKEEFGRQEVESRCDNWPEKGVMRTSFLCPGLFPHPQPRKKSRDNKIDDECLTTISQFLCSVLCACGVRPLTLQQETKSTLLCSDPQVSVPVLTTAQCHKRKEGYFFRQRFFRTKDQVGQTLWLVFCTDTSL